MSIVTKSACISLIVLRNSLRLQVAFVKSGLTFLVADLTSLILKLDFDPMEAHR